MDGVSLLLQHAVQDTFKKPHAHVMCELTSSKAGGAIVRALALSAAAMSAASSRCACCGPPVPEVSSGEVPALAASLPDIPTSFSSLQELRTTRQVPFELWLEAGSRKAKRLSPHCLASAAEMMRPHDAGTAAYDMLQCTSHMF